jgi:hypothetical protein
MLKKLAKSEMVTGRLVDSYKKPLLRSIFKVNASLYVVVENKILKLKQLIFHRY